MMCIIFIREEWMNMYEPDLARNWYATVAACKIIHSVQPLSVMIDYSVIVNSKAHDRRKPNTVNRIS